MFTIFLPAAGGRLETDSSLFGLGSRGLYWSSIQQSGGVGFYLQATATLSDVAAIANKAYALSIRCVRWKSTAWKLFLACCRLASH